MAPVDTTPRTYVGAYGICRDQHARLLLVRMAAGQDRGRWTMPGGGVEWGEHPDVAFRRELIEETGISILQLAHVAHIYSHTYAQGTADPPNALHHIGIVYRIEVDAEDLVHEVDGSTDRAAWFTQEEARGLPLTPAGAFAVRLAWPSPDKSESD